MDTFGTWFDIFHIVFVLEFKNLVSLPPHSLCVYHILRQSNYIFVRIEQVNIYHEMWLVKWYWILIHFQNMEI